MSTMSPDQSSPQSKAAPPKPLWTHDEFNLLAVRVANEPERVRAAIDLFNAKLVNVPMLKDLLDIR